MIVVFKFGSGALTKEGATSSGAMVAGWALVPSTPRQPCAAPWYQSTVTVGATVEVTGSRGLVRTANRSAQIPAQTFRSLPSVSKRVPPNAGVIGRHQLFADPHGPTPVAQALILAETDKSSAPAGRAVDMHHRGGACRETCPACPPACHNAWVAAQNCPDQPERWATKEVGGVGVPWF